MRGAIFHPSITPAQWADVLVIAPLSANTLAKLAIGLCDTLLTCVFRAWDKGRRDKPIVVAPAMNTKMWEDPVTALHLGALRERYAIRTVGPVVKQLACKDVGMGAMAEPRDIAATVMRAWDEACDLRCWNRSLGK